MKLLPSFVLDFLDSWELSIMVLFSLSLQVFLTPMGLMRKYSSKNWARLLLLFAYLSVNWVATISLSMLFSPNCGYSEGLLELRYVIRAFWAPFLLLHIGGPDTITAYSIKDNDLWHRHCLGLLLQVCLVIYVFLKALQPTTLNFLSIPVFVVGFIKYGERIWVMRSASSQHLRDRLLSGRQLSPNALKFRSRRYGFPIRITVGGEGTDNNNPADQGRPTFSDLQMLHIAYCFFERNKRLFADLVLSSYDLKRSLHYFERFDSISTFKVIELELGFMYDFFYTKASIIFSRRGILLRLTNLAFIAIAIITFCMNDNQKYPKFDVHLTFVLLFGVLGLEIFSFLLFLCSDWCVIWLNQSSCSLAHLTFKAISCTGGWSFKKSRWSNSVPQYNLITHCLKDKKYYCNFFRISCITEIFMPAPGRISNELGKKIYEQLKRKLQLDEERRKLPGWILRERDCFGKLSWSLGLDLDRSILLWHLATDLCYYSDHQVVEPSNSSVLEDSKSLSNFLTYLLAYRHSIFPNGMVHIRFRVIVDEAIDFLREESIKTATDACKSMLEFDSNYIDHLPTKVEEDEENEVSSLFYHGCKLAFELQELGEISERWEIISHVWVEMLANISGECKWYDHIEQLRDGGDLLTHVWLLMHHLGYIK